MDKKWLRVIELGVIYEIDTVKPVPDHDVSEITDNARLPAGASLEVLDANHMRVRVTFSPDRPRRVGDLACLCAILERRGFLG